MTATITISVVLVLDNGSLTRPQVIPNLQVESIPNGVAIFTDSVLRFANPQHRGATALWFYLNNVPWHLSEDWPGFAEWTQDAPDPLVVEWDGVAVVELA